MPDSNHLLNFPWQLNNPWQQLSLTKCNKEMVVTSYRYLNETRDVVLKLITVLVPIDFSKDSFYVVVENGVSLFAPENSRYKICFYSSFVQEHLDFLEKNIGMIPLIAVDFYQQRNFSTQNIKEIRIASALMLKLIHAFNI